MKNITAKHIKQLAEEITEVMESLKIDSPYKSDITLDYLIKSPLSYGEVFVDIHLINGDVVTLRNDCIGGFEHKTYMGPILDSAFSDGDIMLKVSARGDDGNFHVMTIPLMSICWIDSHHESVDWKAYKLKQNEITWREIWKIIVRLLIRN